MVEFTKVNVLEVIVEAGSLFEQGVLTTQSQGTEVTAQTEVSITGTFFAAQTIVISVEFKAVECLQTAAQVFSATDAETGNATVQIPIVFLVVIKFFGNNNGMSH